MFMSRDKGYIAIFRDISEHWIWKQKPFSKGQAWIDLILLANHKEEKKPYKDTVMNYERGKVYRSELQLAERWGWNRKTVRKFLRQLKNDGMIDGVWTTQGTTLTIVNYSFYQNPKAKGGQQRDNAMDNAMDNGVDTYKKDKNYKNDEELKEEDLTSSEEDEDDGFDWNWDNVPEPEPIKKG